MAWSSRSEAEHRSAPRNALVSTAWPVLALLLLSSGTLAPSPASADQITMTVLYDNYVSEPGTIADWGFSCLIEGAERTILFDTGYDGSILMQNVEALQVDLDEIDDIVISHDHLDHTGGLNTVLAANSDVNVYFGATFPASFEQNVIFHGATPIRVSDPVEICSHVLSTGEIAGPVYEQSLIVDSDQGLVVIAGCSHPGVITILQRTLEIISKNVYLIFGGFHLGGHSSSAIQQIISSCQAIGVENVGPTHCTGDAAIQLFQQAYGEHCIAIGTGKVIEVTALTAVEEHHGAHRPFGRLLEPNVPNPFNPVTTIAYNLTGPSMVRVRILDVSGNVLRTLVDRQRAGAGRYEITWNGRDHRGRSVASGVYYCQLETGDRTETLGMTLVR
jgi:7,8-dihydropterin-6-yl-methyl-4-(beta-D-ribofuranosyl)aminobenzene 5'-phosphate synthase